MYDHEQAYFQIVSNFIVQKVAFHAGVEFQPYTALCMKQGVGALGYPHHRGTIETFNEGVREFVRRNNEVIIVSAVIGTRGFICQRDDEMGFAYARGEIPAAEMDREWLDAVVCRSESREGNVSIDAHKVELQSGGDHVAIASFSVLAVGSMPSGFFPTTADIPAALTQEMIDESLTHVFAFQPLPFQPNVETAP